MDFTPNETFNSVKLNDRTVKVIAYVEKIKATKLVRSNHQYKVFSFVINNDSGIKVAVTILNENVHRFEDLIRLNDILHIDGAESKRITDLRYNKGNVNYQLVLNQNTDVSIIGRHELTPRAQTPSEAVLMGFEELGVSSGFVRIRRYIKSTIHLLTYSINGEVIHYGCGSITDGENKVEIRVNSFKDTEIFEKGDHVEVLGYIKSSKQGNIVYIAAKHRDKVTLIDENRMPFIEVLSGNKVPIKKYLQ